MSPPDFMPSIEATTDADLVTACLGGNRRAFGQIVERYQRLLCSLAYSATGQVSQSEDLAQDAFIEAWRQLRNLREPEKLRSWLCGILRYKISRLRRSDRTEPVRQADTLDAAGELASSETPAADVAAQKEEQAILWSELERVPELYREPLVLYYREHRSVEHVAVALDLTEDTVKQRLARGRKILQEQVLAFVEGALVRSNPGNVFTIGVLAMLPEMATPSKIALVGTAAARGGMLAKSTGLAALLASVSGIVSAVLTLRANLDQARTARERRAVVKITLAFFFGAFAFLGALYLLRSAAFHWEGSRAVFAIACQLLVLAFVGSWPVLLLRTMRRMRVLRSTERRLHPELFSHAVDQVGSSAGQYLSRWRLFGVPLVHVRYSSPDEGEPPIFAWFAGGDRAFGLLCAWGGFAVAPVSVGAFSVGLFAIGSLSVGWISLGTVAVGFFAWGCAAIGVKAFAWLSALGFHTAQSDGFAIARVAAEGGVALAPHANDPVAHSFLANPNAGNSQMFIIIVLSILTLVPVGLYARTVRQRLGQRARTRGAT